jgi:hypothetical protein
MTIKSIIIVIIISIATGAAIYYLSTPKANNLKNASAPKEVPITTDSIASPSPLPSEPPIDKNTDLSAEIKNQVSPDFSDDYKKLKEAVNTTF